MTSFDQLVDRQLHLFGLISRSLVNFHKLSPDKQTKTAAEARQKLLDSNWGKFELNHEELLSLKTETTKRDQYFTDDLYALCEESYIEATGTLAAIIDVFHNATVQNAIVNNNTSCSASHSRSLPKVNLPKFSGLFAEWIPFRDLFFSMVVGNTDLSNVERLHYLRTHVTDEAERLIVNLPITGENFDLAWRTLTSHYENKRLLAKGHFDTIFSIKPLARESASELKTLIATLKQTLSALKLLGAETESWDPLIVYLAERLLDPRTHRAWEINQGKSTNLDQFNDFEDFLLSRIRVLEAVEKRVELAKPSGSTPKCSKGSKMTIKSYSATGVSFKCSLCEANHYVAACPSYRSKTPQQRREILELKQLCFNCLGPHRLSACRSIKRCLSCGQQHHTSIHGIQPQRTAPAEHNQSSTSTAQTASTSQALHVAAAAASSKEKRTNGESDTSDFALLATASVTIIGPHGYSVVIRALLDQGSELSFITESLAQRLNLERKHASIPLIGIGAQRATTTRGKVECEIQSRVRPGFSCNVTAYILPRLTSRLPSDSIRGVSWPQLENLELADPDFGVPGRVDLLIGADVYGTLLCEGLRRGAPGTPVAQSTALGWIVSGPVPASRTRHCGLTHSSLSVDEKLDDLVQKFWEQEKVSQATNTMTKDEARCEEHFRNTHSRTQSGRYVVRLPTKMMPERLGDSRSIAFRALARVQRRCGSDREFARLYNNFLEEYESLGHMTRVAPEPSEPTLVFYLPHHGVLREVSATTKLRVVFNGSQTTNLGLSLNEHLYPGPKLQIDLADVLLLWRRHQFVFSADIEKMFRQILVDSRDWNLQRILWAPMDSGKAPVSYHLCTVTYGLACAPYLALRVLKQLAADQGSQYPLAQEILTSEIYVDDVLSGADTLPLAREKLRQLDALLMAGGFQLQKWIANESTLLDSIAPNRQALSGALCIDESPVSRTLGLHWLVDRDRFTFRVDRSLRSQGWTKRTVLSVIARLFDPLGWLSPVTVVAKILFQGLWRENLGWDDPFSKTMTTKWIKFYEELPLIETLSVPRWLGGASDSDVELHGFSDASTEALAACVYLRVLNPQGKLEVNLVAAKTRVAPLKPMTVPRLELSAAVLLTRLLAWVRDILRLQSAPLHLWTDSTVALTWIKEPPSRWRDFVRNRSALIQDLLPSGTWHHVKGEDNPADLASRGLSPRDLQDCSDWWHGPSWLRQSRAHWPNSVLADEPLVDLEERPLSAAIAVPEIASEFFDFPDRVSSLRRLLRMTAWIFRAAARFRSPSPDLAASVPLRPSELSQALDYWTRQSQRRAFTTDLRYLKEQQEISRASGLLRLSPFLDSDGILRVGGRLRNSTLDTTNKHPAILSPNSRLATLLIADAHLRTLHGGVQITLATLRESFWVLGGRRPVRAHILRCISCARQRARTAQQLMGQLPATRVSPSRPFLHSGIDYAGPFLLKAWHGRTHKTYKGYLVVFVCFATSAVHLEVTTDYSTAGFLAAYKRFTGRRGVSATLTSDCGTNLVGADAELRRLFSAATKDWQELATTLASDGTQWRFNPPGAPHFGGKWEAAVKSVKFHLRRIIGSNHLTYEEFSTLLIQIEAVLNSRPLCPLSDDPDDLEALTPGHFLVGGPVTAPPEPSLIDVTQSRLSRWQLVRQMERFWRRWSGEYLQRLQGISKWQRRNESVKPGDIALVLDERYPPTKWPLGRVIKVHPGADGLTRVVTIKTATTTLQRPIVKICLLPIEAQHEDKTS